MMKDLRTAAHSQLINPAFIKELASVKEKNKEHGTSLLKRRAICMVDAARRQFRYLRKLLDMEPAC